jgi:hypothetical protein
VFVVQAVDFEALGDSPSSSTRVRAVVPPVTRGNCISGTIARAPTCNYLRARTLNGSNNEYEITKPRIHQETVCLSHSPTIDPVSRNVIPQRYNFQSCSYVQHAMVENSRQLMMELANFLLLQFLSLVFILLIFVAFDLFLV